eukprot:s4761_g6.t1
MESVCKCCTKDLSKVRSILKKDLKRSAFGNTKGEKFHLPVPLQSVLEDVICTRLNLGEEVESLQDTIPEACLKLLKDRDAEIAELPQDKIEQRVNQLMAEVQAKLSPIAQSSSDASLEHLAQNVM